MNRKSQNATNLCLSFVTLSPILKEPLTQDWPKVYTFLGSLNIDDVNVI